MTTRDTFEHKVGLLFEIYRFYMEGNLLLSNTCIFFSSDIRDERYKELWDKFSTKRLASHIFERSDYAESY